MPHRSLTLEQVIGFLLETPMFGDLDAAELAEIVSIMQVQRVRAGQVVFREGEGGDAWYVVEEGEVRVTKHAMVGPSEELARLGPRSCFGEMALIDGSPRSATVTALGAVVLFRFPKADFDNLLADDNLAAYKLIRQMAKVLCDRQRRMTNRITDLVVDEHPVERIRSGLRPVIEEHSVSE